MGKKKTKSLPHDPKLYSTPPPPKKKNPLKNIVEKAENAGYRYQTHILKFLVFKTFLLLV